MGRAPEDRTPTGAETRAGVVCPLGGDCLGLALVVGSFNRTSPAAFPGLRGTGFWGPLLGPAFLEVSDPVGFLLPAETEPGERVGGTVLGVPVPKTEATVMAGGRAALGGPGLVVGRGLRVAVRAEAGLLARLAGLASAGATVERAVGGRGRVLGAGGRATTGFLWGGFAVGWGTLTGPGRGVGGAGFGVGGAVLVNEDRAAFWVG